MKGFSLLEVLIALVILSLGMLAIAKLQLVAVSRDYDSYLVTQMATQLASLYEHEVDATLKSAMPDIKQQLAEFLPAGEIKTINTSSYQVCCYSRFLQSSFCLPK